MSKAIKKYTQADYDSFPFVDSIKVLPGGDYTDINFREQKIITGQFSVFGDDVTFMSCSVIGAFTTIGLNARFCDEVELKNGCTVGDGAEFMEDCTIGYGSTLENIVALDGLKVGSDCKIKKASIGNFAVIGSGCIIGNTETTTTIGDDYIVGTFCTFTNTAFGETGLILHNNTLIKCSVGANTEIGNELETAERCSFGLRVNLGCNCKISNDSLFVNFNKIGNYCTIGDGVTFRNGIELGNDCKIGKNLTMKRGSLGENTTVYHGGNLTEVIIGTGSHLLNCNVLKPTLRDDVILRACSVNCVESVENFCMEEGTTFDGLTVNKIVTIFDYNYMVDSVGNFMVARRSFQFEPFGKYMKLVDPDFNVLAPSVYKLLTGNDLNKPKKKPWWKF